MTRIAILISGFGSNQQAILAPYTKAGRPREAYDADLAGILRVFGVEWVVQAGWKNACGELVPMPLS